MDKYQLLVKGDNVGMVIDDWMYSGKCDLTLRMAKTKGCRVIETTAPPVCSENTQLPSSRRESEHSKTIK